MIVDLFKKFKLGEKLDEYDVFYGKKFPKLCKVVGKISSKRFGGGGTMEANPNGMELLVKDKDDVIICYVGINPQIYKEITNIKKRKDLFIGLARKRNE